MEFRSDRPIYRQIIDYAFGCILDGVWTPGQRVPSVRELTVDLAVNSHTVLKAYEHLQAHEIIISKRGMGFFLAEDARERVNADRRQEFFDTTLADIFGQMDRLGVDIEELIVKYREFRKNQAAEG